MKKLASCLLILSFFTLFASCEKEPAPPEPISPSYSARLHITKGENEYGAEISGTDKMIIISPEALSFLEFSKENGAIVAKFGKKTISDEQAVVPLKDLFSSLSDILKTVGVAEYEYSQGTFSYFSDGCVLKVDFKTGLPRVFIGNGYTVKFL